VEQETHCTTQEDLYRDLEISCQTGLMPFFAVKENVNEFKA
jgi:hypothetical protein